MGIAKVTLNNETLMDITDDTVTASGLMLGDTAHGANGESVTGTYVPVTYDVATETTDGLMSASDKVKLNGVATGAEVNQNAFSNVKVGTTTIAADSKTDTLTLTAGTNITLTPNATSDSVTIAVNGMPSKVSDLDNDSGFITSSGTASNVSGTVAIEHGGTGATSASAARTNLGLGSAATASTSSTVGNNSSLPTGAAIQSYVTGLGYTTNTGTVTSIATGAGLTGGTITGSGTIKADLKSETKSSLTAASKGSTSGREYAVGLDANGDLSVNVPWENTQTVTGVKGSSESSYRTGNVSISATNIGLGNVENKSSATIRGELTKSNVTTALGFTPYTQDEVNALVSSVFTYKGTKSTYAQVSALTGMKTGDVWQVTADNSEYVYNGSAWEKLGPTIDLSGYLTSVSVAGQSLTPGSNSITAEQLKTALGLGSAAYASTASSVGNNTNLPTGAAVQSYVTGLGYTTNTGTITEIKMNGSSKGTSGSVDLGTVITAHQTIKQDGVTGATVNRFGTCGIAAGTAAKTVAITTGTFSLETGAKVTVKFTYANTASNPTLNVGGTGAKNIFHRGSRITTGTNKALLAGTCEFVYDGTQYHLIGNYYDTTYSSLDAASGGTSVSLVTTGEKYTWNQKTSNTGTVTSVATGTGLTGGPITTTGTISLEGGVVTAGSAGPTAAVTGNEGNTVAIPRITVDEYGRVTGLTSYNLTNKNTTYTAATTAPGNVASSSAVGTSTNYARQDHTHGITLATGDSNGQVKIAGTNVDVKGWNTAATYDVESTLANDSKLPTGAAVYNHTANRTFYGTCSTAAATAAKVVELEDGDGFELKPGVVVGVKFSATNTASNMTLNVNNTGAIGISYIAGTRYTGSTANITGSVSYVFYYMYDGTYWTFFNHSGNYSNNSNTVPSAQCETAAATAAKTATCTNHTLTANTYLHFNIRYANTAKSALTMNVDSSGAKPVYINGAASSASNYTLPAGTYIAFYNGTYWDFRTDGKLPASITGTVNGHSVNADVPSDLNTKLANIPDFGTVGSNQNPVYFDNGDPTPIAFTFGVDDDQNVQVAWDGDAPEIVIPTTSALAISSGGTGATTAAGARTNLGLGSAATYNVVSSVNNDSNLVTGAAIKNYYEAVGIPSAICTTAAGTASKVATCSSYKLLANSYIQVIMANANTASSALTLNINGTGDKSIYINGSASYSGNKTLPAGSYFVFYDGTNYYFRTDGKITADITGNAATVNSHTVESNVPTNAVFTDTTDLTQMTGTLTAAHGGTGQTSLQATRNAMGLGNTTGALPIENGGTNATTASAARTNLGWGTVSTYNCTTSNFVSTYVSNVYNLYYKKIGNIVMMNGLVMVKDSAITASTQITIGTIPEAYRPITEYKTILSSMIASWASPGTPGAVGAYASFNTNGNIVINKGTNTLSSGLMIHETWIGNFE